MIVISNTTPLIGLASIQQFDLLYKLFGKIYIAPAVYREGVICGREHGGAKREISSASWIEQVAVKDRDAVAALLKELDSGEAETIVLARQINADWVIMDEKKGRQKLAALGMNKIGTVGILLKAKQIGLLSEIRPEIERLCRYGFSLSRDVIDAILSQANE